MTALWQAWKRIARRIGDFQARVLLTVFYYAVLGPFALLLRLRGGALALRPGSSGGWRRREEPAGDALAHARHQS